MDAHPSLGFVNMLEMLRAGDPETIRAFVAQYEPFIRRTMRRRLARTPLQAVADSADVCQSALASFFIRFAGGEFQFDNRRAMENLLFTIARRKLAALARREAALCRNRFQTVHDPLNRLWPTDEQSEPLRSVLMCDVLDVVDRRLPAADQALFRRRREGQSWEQIAGDMQISAVVLRKRLSRALHTVAVELGVDERDE